MKAGPLAIIADDLTGALDAAAPLSSGGDVVVATLPEAVGRALAIGARVVSVSTRSREIPADLAKLRVAQIDAALPKTMLRFKKVDSRLKGNIAAELAALRPPFLVMPAIPEFDRIVEGGMLSGFGIDRPINVAAAIGQGGAVISDTKTLDDMVNALAEIPQTPSPTLVGARGLAQALAEVWGLDQPPRPEWHAPICFAIGSTDPITLQQIKVLRARHPDLTYVAAPGGVVPAPRGAAEITLLQIIPGTTAPHDDVGRTFAATAAPYLRRARTLVLSGGATAEALLDALEIDLLHVTGEALPGMPFSRAEGQVIVTKSGGFGRHDALAFLAEMALAGAHRKTSEEARLGTG